MVCSQFFCKRLVQHGLCLLGRTPSRYILTELTRLPSDQDWGWRSQACPFPRFCCDPGLPGWVWNAIKHTPAWSQSFLPPLEKHPSQHFIMVHLLLLKNKKQKKTSFHSESCTHLHWQCPSYAILNLGSLAATGPLEGTLRTNAMRRSSPSTMPAHLLGVPGEPGSFLLMRRTHVTSSKALVSQAWHVPFVASSAPHPL